MISPFLRCLVTDSFTDNIGFVLPPAPLRRVLQRSHEVRRLGALLRFGLIAQQDVKAFVDQLTMDFRPGELFPHDIALAALAVAMEHWHCSFAEDYLLDLARVERPEFRASFRVARECLKARYAFPRTQVKEFQYPKGNAPVNRLSRSIRALPQTQRVQRPSNPSRWLRYHEVTHADA